MARMAWIARSGMVLAAAAAVVMPATAAQAEAARSVDVYIHNNTPCTFVQPSKETYHGIWTDEAPGAIPSGGTGYMRTESDGFLTGTEAAVAYQTSDCNAEGRNVRFHWNDPYSGRNSYDFDNTDGAFHGRYEGGNGDNATVDAFFQLRQ